MSVSPSPVRQLRARLGGLRRRIRVLFLAQGAFRWLTAALGALLLFFLADWLLDLPLAVRRFVRLGLLDRPEAMDVLPWAFLLLAALVAAWIATRRALPWAPLAAFAAAGLVGVLFWVAARSLAPLTFTLPDEDLALSVEARFGHLDDRLAAALDFERELGSPTRGESEAMMTAVVGQAVEEAGRLEFTKAVSARRSLAWGGIALACVALGAGLLAAAPDVLGRWARRSLLLVDEAWPRSTTVLAVDLDDEGRATPRDPLRAYEVPVGRPLTVLARAEGDVPEEVQLLDLVEGGRPLPRRMFPVQGRPGLFQVEIRDVRRPFAFVLRGGDDEDDDPRYQVQITVPPRVLEISAHLTYPQYLGRAPETVEGGLLQVPEGTRVEMTLTTDMPVAEARVVLQEQVVAAQPVADDAMRFAFSVTATQSVRYRVLLKTPEGRENDPARDTYEIRVEPDLPPRVTWVYPRGPIETTPGARVPLLLEAADDHAVADLAVEVRRGDADAIVIPLGPRARPGEGAAEGGERRPALDGGYGRKEIRIYLPLELPSLEDAEGRAPGPADRLGVRIVAKDSKGQTKEGPWTSVDVYRPLEMQRSLDGRRPGVRAEIVAALAEQQVRRKQVADLVGSRLTEAELDLLKTVQFAQGKLAQDVDQSVRALLDLFNAFVHGRLGAEIPNEKVLAILDRHLRTSYGLPPQDEAPGSAAPLGDPVFPYRLYDEVAEAWRTRVLFDTGLLDRLLAVVAESVDAASRHAPAAHAAVQAAASRTGSLEEALTAQDALSRSLDRVLEHMRGWETLSDLITKLRRIAEEQETLTRRLKPDDGSD